MFCIQFLFKNYDIWEFDVDGIYHAFALLILIYGLGGEHYYMLTCDWPHSYII